MHGLLIELQNDINDQKTFEMIQFPETQTQLLNYKCKFWKNNRHTIIRLVGACLGGLRFQFLIYILPKKTFL